MQEMLEIKQQNDLLQNHIRVILQHERARRAEERARMAERERENS